MSDVSRSIKNGALVAAAQLAAGELAAASMPGARSPLSGVGRVLIDAMPGVAVDVVVATAQSSDKTLLRISLGAASAGVGVAACREQVGASRGALGLASAGLIGGLAAAAQRDTATGPSLGAGLAAGGAGALARAVLAGSTSTAARWAIGTAAIAAAAAAARLRRAQHARFEAERECVRLPSPEIPAGPIPPGAELPVAGITPLFTDARDFYVTDVQFSVPRIAARGWRLTVSGMVDRPLSLSLDDLLGMPLVELDAALVCVHNPVGGTRISGGRWLGLPVTTLLEQAGVQSDAEQLVARSVDGFTAGVPVQHVLQQPALIALGYGGVALAAANGYPARLLCPGLWGADANTKWLSELELTTWGAVRDYWDRRGWPRAPSPVRPGSRIDVPRNRATVAEGLVTAAGVAWAPPRGVLAVELSLDGGPWQPAELGAEVSPAMWRHWRLSFEIPAGEHRLAVRTIGRGDVQGPDQTPPYPAGASGQHSIRLLASADAPSRTRRLRARLAAVEDGVVARAALAAAGTNAWLSRGYPPPPRHAAPQPGPQVGHPSYAP